MNRINDDDLKRYYEQFSQRHATLRDELIDRLPGAEASRDLGREQALSRWAMRSIGSAAALLLMGVLLWTFVVPSATPVYGIEDMADRLMEVESLYVKGYRFEKFLSGDKIPVEYFVERPHRYWHARYKLVEDGNDWKRVWTNYSASDGSQYIRVNETDKECVIGVDIPLAAELFVESFLQYAFPEGATADALSEFTKVGEERFKDTQVDVYQREFFSPIGPNTYGTRAVVWLNPQTGLPVKWLKYVRFGPYLGPDRHQNDHLIAEFHDIRTNVPPGKAMFDFSPPRGYAVSESARKVDEFRSWYAAAGMASQEAQLSIAMAFNIDDRAVLMYWSAYRTPANETTVEHGIEGTIGERIEIPDLTVADKNGGYELYFLRADPVHTEYYDFHRRWSLVIPKDQPRTIGPDIPAILWDTDPNNERNSISVLIQPLRFSEDQLAQVVVEAQRVTLPEDHRDEQVLTLEQLTGLIDRLSIDLGGETLPQNRSR